MKYLLSHLFRPEQKPTSLKTGFSFRFFAPAFFVFFFFMLTGILQAQNLRVGAALRIITPNPLLPVSGGIGVPHPVTEKRGDLFVRAMVFEQGTTRFAIVNIDNLGWTSILGNRSRALIKGILPENILIGATHTHNAFC